jgi:anti-sigma regulatory factor (Ser/Thr protein kinase)
MLRLKIHFTKRLVKAYDIIDGLVLGRDPSCGIQVLKPSVSRKHARLNIADGRVVVTDLGSANGVKVNGKTITVQPLKEGDAIELGNVKMALEKETVLPPEEELIDLRKMPYTQEKVEELSRISRLGIIFPTADEYIEKAWRMGEKYILARNFPVEEHERTTIALREAIGNAERHGNKYDREKMIRVYFLDGETMLQLAIEDEGGGFDFGKVIEEVEKKDAITAARERAAAGGHGGLGIKLMQKCVDRIDYELNGCRVILTRNKRPLTPEERAETEFSPEEEEMKTSILQSIEDSRDLIFLVEPDSESRKMKKEK